MCPSLRLTGQVWVRGPPVPHGSGGAMVPGRKTSGCWDQKKGRDASWEHLSSSVLVPSSQIGSLYLLQSLGSQGTLLSLGLPAVPRGFSTSYLKTLLISCFLKRSSLTVLALSMDLIRASASTCVRCLQWTCLKQHNLPGIWRGRCSNVAYFMDEETEAQRGSAS